MILQLKILLNNIKINYLRSLISVGAPDFFHAVYPPLIWATGDKPIFWIASVASAERWPNAQKKINFLPDANISL